MSQHVEFTGEIDAPLEFVYQVVADVTRYPEFLPDVQAVTQEGDVVRMTVRLGLMDVSWRSRATFTPHESIHIELVDGPFQEMDVHWAFAHQEGKTHVTYTTDFALLLPIPGVNRIASRAIAANAKATMHAFLRRVQALQQDA